MDAKLKQLQEQLDAYEKDLDLAYINYAKIVDSVVSQEMIKINEMVDRIIILKKMIHEEEGSVEHD